MNLPVAILAGGLATRLRPITEKIPKSLVDVNDEPFIVHQLRYLRGQGISLVVICIGYLGEQVEAVVGDGSAYGLRVVYSYDGETLLGTGGALRKALPYLGEHFFVFYGDSYLPINFKAIKDAYFASAKPALMTVLRNDDQWDKSNVLFDKGAIIEYNKQEPSASMKHIDYGLGILSAPVLKSMPLKSFDLAKIYYNLSLDGDLAGYEVFERFYEIGSHKGLEETRNYLKKNKDL